MSQAHLTPTFPSQDCPLFLPFYPAVFAASGFSAIGRIPTKVHSIQHDDDDCRNRNYIANRVAETVYPDDEYDNRGSPDVEDDDDEENDDEGGKLLRAVNGEDTYQYEDSIPVQPGADTVWKVAGKR